MTRNFISKLLLNQKSLKSQKTRKVKRRLLLRNREK
jgi:hypothetical protein